MLFLQFNEQDILQNAGKVTKKVADELAEDAYETFNEQRVLEQSQQLGDIDKAIKEIT